jgi:hypothetical protein
MNKKEEHRIEPTIVLEQLVSPRHIIELYPNLYSERELKSLIKNRRYNGLNQAVHKIPGRKLMIYIPGFRVWVQSRMNKL